MSNQATMNFDTALPYLRRGFILRIHGAADYDNCQLREDGGKLQFSRGDSNWASAADLPFLDLAYDVYDQKKAEYVDPFKPIVEQHVDKQNAGAVPAAQTSAFTQEAEEELELEALRILEENGERNPTDEQVADMVGQLKAKATQSHVFEDERIFDDSDDDEGELPDEKTQVADGTEGSKKHKRGRKH